MQARSKTPVTWILVADARQAQIYTRRMIERRIPMAGNGRRRHTRESHEVDLAPVLAAPLLAEAADSYNAGRNATGMVFESFSAARHMGTPHMDARKEVKQHFATRIAEFLATAKMGDAFDRLILAAPPEMLGEIDARLEPVIRRKVTARLPKELTHMSAHALLEHMKDVLSIAE